MLTQKITFVFETVDGQPGDADDAIAALGEQVVQRLVADQQHVTGELATYRVVGSAIGDAEIVDPDNPEPLADFVRRREQQHQRRDTH
jgi:hypothetical protein